MGKDKKIVLWIVLTEIFLLTTCIFASYSLTQWLAPGKIQANDSILQYIVINIVSYIASYAINPSVVQERIVNAEDVVRRVCTTVILMLMFNTLLATMTKASNPDSRSFILYTQLAYGIILVVERIMVRKALMFFRSRKRNQKHVILIGDDIAIKRLVDKFSNPIYGYNVTGIFTDSPESFKDTDNILGKVNDVFSWFTTCGSVDEIYAYLPRERQDTINILGKFCDNHLIRLYYVPAIEVFGGKVVFDKIEDIPVIARREEPLSNPFNRLVKRAFDIVASLILLVTIFPFIYIIVGLIIKIKSPGPIFFKQERTGIDGKQFKCIKFRSMKVNNDADRVQATKDDPRKYPFGDFLRRSNIDELPQIINVLLGDMSIVGPRPHMLKHTEEYSKVINSFMLRHLAKPGITGLAQVTGFRGETKHIDQMEGRVQKDIEYIENWTFLLDIKIIFLTAYNMLFGDKNAY